MDQEPVPGAPPPSGPAVAWRMPCLISCGDSCRFFSPRWRPPFVSALAPEDRCHLNGLAMVDGVLLLVDAVEGVMERLPKKGSVWHQAS